MSCGGVPPTAQHCMHSRCCWCGACASCWALAPQEATPPLRGAQFTLGFGAYLYPTVAKRHREALGPLHTYLGKATFVAGLANMAVRSSPRIGALSTSQCQTALHGLLPNVQFCLASSALLHSLWRWL